MGGNVTAAAASSAGLTVYISIMENVVGRSIVPFCGACLAFGWVSAAGLGPGIRSLLSTFKKHYATLLGFLMTILLAMLATQNALASSADTLAMRSARFATGNLIPIVGGSVSELLRTVSAGVKYLRTTLGICAILLLLFLLLPTLIQLLLYRSVWQISASIAETLGCDREKILLDEIASLCGYLIAAVSICSSVLFLSFTLLTRCASAIG
jgi:stage III sporulation protein AE